jgi:hypothetical protein
VSRVDRGHDERKWGGIGTGPAAKERERERERDSRLSIGTH